MDPYHIVQITTSQFKVRKRITYDVSSVNWAKYHTNCFLAVRDMLIAAASVSSSSILSMPCSADQNGVIKTMSSA